MTASATVSVTIDASPQTVFAHLVERDLMLRWMGLDAVIDPRPGGELRIQIHETDKAAGEYVEVHPYDWLVFTWGWEGNESIPPGSSTVRIDLEPVGDGTQLTLTHTDLPDEDAYARHSEGWTFFLARLVDIGAGAEPGAYWSASAG
jgi:uncharacterized protein YndB with AHSA1/START domain